MNSWSREEDSEKKELKKLREQKIGIMQLAMAKKQLKIKSEK